MKINQVWASIIGLVSLTIGILRFVIPSLGVSIPPIDGIIHIVTGIAFLAGAWINNGKSVYNTNLLLGFFYIIFGIRGFNWPHIIVGTISVAIALMTKITKTQKPNEK